MKLGLSIFLIVRSVAHLQGVSIERMNGTQLMVIDISAIISILGPLNSDLLTDKLLENYKHKQRAVH